MTDYPHFDKFDVHKKDQEWVDKYNSYKPDQKTVELVRLDTKTILQAKEIEFLLEKNKELLQALKAYAKEEEELIRNRRIQLNALKKLIEKHS